MKIIRVCTLFDSNFLVQGMALIESVESRSSCKIFWTVLALDDASWSFLQSLNAPNVEIIHIDEFKDSDLQSLRPKRPWNEFCWTSAACLLNYCLAQSSFGQKVVYIDADCYFFDDIGEILKPLESGNEIVIHEHRFSKDRELWLDKSGRFNVGLIAGLNNSEFRMCVQRWRNQVLDRCDVNPLEGRCGDQTYLNEWPNLYPSLYILDSPGAGLAPWNIKNYQIASIDNNIKVDSKKLYFYHFSALEIIFFSRFLVFYIPAAGYLNMNRNERIIYSKYMKHLMGISKVIGRKPRIRFNLQSNVKQLLQGSLVLQVGRF